MRGVLSADRPGLRAAPALLWFGVLGGAVAWTLHTLIGWYLDETVCRSGHDALLGVPLRVFVGVVTLVMLTVAVLATAVAYRMWRQLDGSSPADPGEAQREERASFMALVGLGIDLLSVTIILLGGIGVLVFSDCVR